MNTSHASWNLLDGGITGLMDFMSKKRQTLLTVKTPAGYFRADQLIMVNIPYVPDFHRSQFEQ